MLACEKNGSASIYGTKWYPEDMALLPEHYIKDIDPERDNFGIKSALNLWLELESQGLMKTGMGKKVRPLFEHELAKYLI